MIEYLIGMVITGLILFGLPAVPFLKGKLWFTSYFDFSDVMLWCIAGTIVWPLTFLCVAGGFAVMSPFMLLFWILEKFPNIGPFLRNLYGVKDKVPDEDEEEDEQKTYSLRSF